MTATATTASRPNEFDRTGRVVLGAAMLAAGLTGPGQTIGVSVFTDHFVGDLDLGRSTVSSAYLVGTLGGALLLPTIGRTVDRIGVRRAQIIIGICFAAALAYMSTVGSLVMLALGFFGIRFLGQGSLSLVATVTVSLGFERRRGTALGIYAVGTSALMAAVPILLAWSIRSTSWRTTWLIAAAVIAATVAPLAVVALRSLPEGTRKPSTTAAPPGPSLDRAAAIRTRGFWIVAAVSSTAGLVVTAFNFHQIDLLGEAGLSAEAAAALFAPQVIGSTLTGFGSGWISDRIGTRYLPSAAMGVLFGAHLVGAVVGPGATVVAYSVLIGAAAGSIRTITATLLPRWFGTAHLGSIQGALTFLGVAASAIGPVALSVTRDLTGSYPPALLILGVLPAAAAVFALADPAIDRLET